MLTLQYQGSRAPIVASPGSRKGCFPTRSAEDRKSSGRTASLLRRHDAGTPPSRADAARPARSANKASGVQVHQRSAGGAGGPRDAVVLVDRYQSTFSHHYDFKTNPYGRGGRRGGGDRVREDSPTYAYEDEDQSTGMAPALGMKVRHPQLESGPCSASKRSTTTPSWSSGSRTSARRRSAPSLRVWSPHKMEPQRTPSGFFL